MAKLHIKNCIVCGKPFETKQAKTRYCSRACITEANRSGIGWQTILHRKCVVCGKKFETNKPTKITCGKECKQEVTKMNERELKKQKKAERSRKRNVPTLAEENRRAKELGLTYGQYQAYKYTKGE